MVSAVLPSAGRAAASPLRQPDSPPRRLRCRAQPRTVAATGTSRRGKPRRKPEYGPAMPGQDPGPGGSSMFPDEMFGKAPSLPTPTRDDLLNEGLMNGDGSVPEWVRNMQEAAELGDTDYQAVLQGTDGDPIKIISNINKEMDKKRDSIMNPEPNSKEEEGKKMRVRFRDITHFNVWIWVRLQKEPSAKEKELLQEVFKSWFVMGRLSAYNGMNLQVFHGGSGETSFMEYKSEELETGMTACFHEMSEPEFKGKWCRVWIDLGTADEFSLDVLVNAMYGFSLEHCSVSELLIGGENDDWPVPDLRFDISSPSEGIPKGIDMAQFGDPKEQVPGYELDEMEEITDIDAYLKNSDEM